MLVGADLKDDSFALDNSSGGFGEGPGDMPPHPERFQDGKFSTMETIVGTKISIQAQSVILNV